MKLVTFTVSKEITACIDVLTSCCTFHFGAQSILAGPSLTADMFMKYLPIVCCDYFTVAKQADICLVLISIFIFGFTVIHIACSLS